MNINDQEINIDDLISDEYMHTEVKKGIFLSKYQVGILNSYGIDFNKCSSVNDLLMNIDEVLEVESDADDLEQVSNEISEYNYYANTNK